MGGKIDHSKTGTNQAGVIIEQPGSVSFYFIVTSVTFIIGALLFFVLIYFHDKLDMQSNDRVYYFVLFPLAFSAAAFLFGVMHSWAVYQGHSPNKKLEMGGPVVVAALVIVGGFVLHGSNKFDYTVNIIIDSSVSSSYPAFNGGSLKIYNVNKWEPGAIDQDSDYNFKGLFGDIKNKEVKIKYQFKFYKATESTLKLTGETADLHLIPDGSLSTVRGTIENLKGIGVPGVTVSCNKYKTTTNSDGEFTFKFPPGEQMQTYHIKAVLGNRTGSGVSEPGAGQDTEIPISD